MARAVASTLLVLASMWAAALPVLPCVRGPLVDNMSAATLRIGAQICHQRTERSFVSCGTPWAVCGRCAGLYLGAVLGTMAAVAGVVRRDTSWRMWRRFVIIAAIPTAVLWSVEMSRLWDPGTLLRWAAALPLGAATAAWLAAVARGDLR